jgi:hypothetical protein
VIFFLTPLYKKHVHRAAGTVYCILYCTLQEKQDTERFRTLLDRLERQDKEIAELRNLALSRKGKENRQGGSQEANPRTERERQRH